MSNDKQKMSETAKTLLYLALAFCALMSSAFAAINYFTPRSLFYQACAAEKAQFKTMKEIQNMERDISRTERKMLQYNLEWQSNSTWLNDLDKNFPDEATMPKDLKKQKDKVLDRQELIKRKLEKYENQLEKLEKKMERLEKALEIEENNLDTSNEVTQ